MQFKNMKMYAESDSDVSLLVDQPKHSFAARNAAWGLYYSWRKNELERCKYRDECIQYKELCMLADTIPCKAYRRVWRAFVHSDDVVDQLRTDERFFYEMRQLLTGAHYDAVIYKSEHTKPDRFKKIKTFIFRK